MTKNTYIIPTMVCLPGQMEEIYEAKKKLVECVLSLPAEKIAEFNSIVKDSYAGFGPKDSPKNP